MEPWHAWILLAIGLLILEIFTFTLALAAVALGALVAGALAYLQLDLVWQVCGLGVGTLAGFVGARPFVLRKLHRGDQAFLSNVDALIGRDARVIQSIDADAAGLVLLNGEEWRATSGTSRRIEEGRLVTVVEVEGNRLIVVDTPEIGGG